MTQSIYEAAMRVGVSRCVLNHLNRLTAIDAVSAYVRHGRWYARIGCFEYEVCELLETARRWRRAKSDYDF